MKKNQAEFEHVLFDIVRWSEIERYAREIERADAHMINADGENLLYTAASGTYRGQLIGLDLIKRGVDVNQKSKHGTPLHLAVLHRSKELVKAMLEKGADPNIKNQYGNTALFVAVLENGVGKIDIIKMLTDHGANPNIKNDHEISPLDLAEKIGFRQIIEILTERAN